MDCPNCGALCVILAEYALFVALRRSHPLVEYYANWLLKIYWLLAPFVVPPSPLAPLYFINTPSLNNSDHHSRFGAVL